jgi:hypothetical protein
MKLPSYRIAAEYNQNRNILVSYVDEISRYWKSEQLERVVTVITVARREFYINHKNVENF